MPTNYSISSSGSDVTDLASLATPIPYPKGFFQLYSQMIPLADGTTRGGGWPVASWHWGVLSRAQRDQLRTLLPNSSGSCWIYTRTMDNADAYSLYRASYIWPIEQEERDTGRRLNFQLDFKYLRAS